MQTEANSDIGSPKRTFAGADSALTRLHGQSLDLENPQGMWLYFVTEARKESTAPLPENGRG